MPNWIHQTLYIYGPAAEVARFEREAGTLTPATRGNAPPKRMRGRRDEDDRPLRPEILSFQHLVPPPRTFPRSWPTGKKYLPKSTRWRLIHWGTKWDACWPRKIKGSPRRIRYIFCTPWQPAVPWVQCVARRFPALMFSLHHRHEDCGRATYRFRKGVYGYMHQGRWVVDKLDRNIHCPG